ncbi:MAG: transglycosylase domain-containing protein, partial [Deltaproteobacteria bacterium]
MASRDRSTASRDAPRARNARAGGVRSSRGGRLGKRASPWRWAVRLLALAAFSILVGALGVAATIAYHSRDLPDVRSLRDVEEPQTTRVLDRDGEVLGELFTERRTVVPISRIPRVLVLSVLAAEDADFYVHEGFDYAGLFRAVARGILSGGRFRGTSTITQQLVKNMLLTSERSLARKVRELILAYRLEQEFTKEEILELY